MASSPEYRDRLSWSTMHLALYRMFPLSNIVYKSCTLYLYFYREGTHTKYHYLICGVKGDFTRGLVQNPPTHLWTRQLKVRF